MITVLNMNTDIIDNKSRYIGRGSVLGNPYTSLKGETLAQFKVSTREESVRLFKEYLIKKIEEGDEDIINELNIIYDLALNGKVDLVCFCSPKLCHGHVIKNLIEARIKRNEGTFS